MASKKKRGFASMDEDTRREIARKGGQSSHGGGRPSNYGAIDWDHLGENE